MKVSELITALLLQNPNALVIQSSDPGGNSYSEAGGIKAVLFCNKGSWEGELICEETVQGYEDAGEELPPHIKAVCLWP